MIFVVNNSAELVLSVTLCIFSAFYIYSKYKLSYWKRCGIKSLPTHLVFGNFRDTFTFQKSPGQVIQEIYDAASDCDPYVGFYVFHQPKLLLRDFSLMKQLIIKDFDVFPNRCFGGESEKDSVGLINLLGIHQPRWKYLRQKLTPSVTGLKLRGMIPLIEECGVPLLNYIGNSKADSDGWRMLELKDISSKYTTDVIASLAFGITTNSFDESSIAFWEAGQKILSGAKRGMILIILFFLPGLIKFIENYMVGPAEYFRTIFRDSINAREKNNIQRGDLVDHFINLKNEKQIPEYKFEGDNILAQAVSFYVAGFEATSTAISFSLHELARHPEYEKRLYREIKDNLTGKEITLDLLNQMIFLHQVVDEALRLYPPLPIVDRVAVKDYKLPGSDIVIKKGTPVYISVSGTNRDPKYFERPNEFIPTRTRGAHMNDLSSSSLAFGMGPRSCVGQRLGLIMTKMALITILREYTLTNEKKGETVLKPITVFTAAADGVHVKLKKRQ